VPDAKQYISESIDHPEVLYSTTLRYGIDRGLRWSFRGWHKNGFGNATSLHRAAIRTLSSI
jgi:hypothetical protein